MTPVILGGGYLTLDALLASLIFENTGDIEVPHDTVPVLRDEILLCLLSPSIINCGF
jgi:hypothetical protein